MIEVRNLTKSYQSGDLMTPVLKGISFTIQDGELCAIMGPSGSGKSTLLNILGCLDSPTGGDYVLDGENVATFDESRLAQVRNQKLGFVFQSFNLLKRTAAIEQVMLPLLYENVEPHERHDRAMAALGAVGLADKLDALPNQLSGGEQQRVAIARALVNRPSLILADEPTGNLDTKTSVEIMEIFQEFNRELGITILFVTHEPDIAQYTRRILHIRDGILESDEPVVAVHSATADLAARAATITPLPSEAIHAVREIKTRSGRSAYRNTAVSEPCTYSNRHTGKRKEGSVMHLELGATVRSADDQAVGTVDQFVIDGNTHAVAQFILRTGRFHNHDFLVSLDTIAREDDDNTLHLTLSATQVRALPEFEEQNFVVANHAEQTQWRYLIPTMMAGGTVPSLPDGRVIGGSRAYDPAGNTIFGIEDPTNETIETWSNLLEQEYREGKGTKVVTCDDHSIGVLHGVDVDEAGKPTAIVVATGLLHREYRTIPIAQVRSAGAHRILLTLTRAEYEREIAQPLAAE